MDEAKKKIAEESKANRSAIQSNNNSSNNNPSKTEVQGVHVEVGNEFSCSTIEYSQEYNVKEVIGAAILALTSGSQQLLKYPDVWFGNTGATQHSTFSGIGGTNKH